MSKRKKHQEKSICRTPTNCFGSHQGFAGWSWGRVPVPSMSGTIPWPAVTPVHLFPQERKSPSTVCTPRSSPCTATVTALMVLSSFPALAASVNTAQLRDHAIAPSVFQDWALVPISAHYLGHENVHSLKSLKFIHILRKTPCYSQASSPLAMDILTPISHLYSILKLNFLLPSTQMLSVIATPIILEAQVG